MGKSRITMAMAMTSAIAVAVVFVFGTVAASDEGFVGVGCEESSTCPCPKNLDPVCDGQGKEYGNQCIFDCVKERCPDYKNIVKTACAEDKYGFRSGLLLLCRLFSYEI